MGTPKCFWAGLRFGIAVLVYLNVVFVARGVGESEVVVDGPVLRVSVNALGCPVSGGRLMRFGFRPFGDPAVITAGAPEHDLA